MKIPATSIDWVERIYSTLETYKDGNCSILVNYSQDNARGNLSLGADWKVQPQDDLIVSLRDQFGQESVIMRYD